MKKIALISTFCDTQEKLDILEKNIIAIKSYNMDVMVISPFYLEKNMIALCDYFFLTKDNPVLDWPQKAMCHWSIHHHEGKDYKFIRTYPDYGFSGLSQVKQLSEIAINLNYDQYHHIIYDLIIDQNVIDGFLSDKICNVYPSKRDDTIWAVGLHYMIFDKQKLMELISHITLDNYLSCNNGDAFAWLHSLQPTIGYQIEETPVEDAIYFYQDFDFFNYLTVPDIKMFIHKNDYAFNADMDTIKLAFYDTFKSIKLLIDDVATHHNINNFLIIDLQFNKTNYKNVVLEVDSIQYDITKTIQDVKHNVIEHD
jgi:hypothetical protein